MSKEQQARLALQQALTSSNPFYDTLTCFIQHHLAEIPESYWLENFGSPQPDAAHILKKLQLSDPNDSDEDSLDQEEREYEEHHLDFELPDEISQYVLCVSFENEQVVDISMES